LIRDDPRRYLPQIVPDHGGGAGGRWRDKSENPGTADQGRRLAIEWTAGL